MLFSKSGRALSSGDVKVNASGTVRIVVGDLAPGAGYRLTAGHTSMTLVSTDAGTIFAKAVELAPGDGISLRRVP